MGHRVHERKEPPRKKEIHARPHLSEKKRPLTLSSFWDVLLLFFLMLEGRRKYSVGAPLACLPLIV